jgi:glycosyltransferase involved in cell wall biosynthesis
LILRGRNRREGSTSNAAPKVLLVQPLFAHYRYATLFELAERKDLDFAFAAGADTVQGNVATFDSSLLGRAAGLKNIWIGPFLWQRGLLRALSAQRYDAVVITGSDTHLSAWAVALLCRLRGVKVLFWTTGWHRPDTGARRLFRLAFYRLADQVLLYNRRGYELGAQAGYPTSKMTVIFNSQGSPPAPLSDDRDPASLDAMTIPHSDKPTILAVVRLIPLKKLSQTIEAAAVLAAAGSPVRLVFAGDGPDREVLKARARELDVELVLTGGIYEEERLRRLYEQATVTVVPGPVGLTAVQSMKFGVPVVSHSNPDHQVAEWEAIREGETGGLFVEDDPRDLARAISLWLNLAPDRQLSVHSKCVVEYESKWTPQGHADRIAQAVREAVSGSSRVPGHAS